MIEKTCKSNPSGTPQMAKPRARHDDREPGLLYLIKRVKGAYQKTPANENGSQVAPWVLNQASARLKPSCATSLR